MGAELGHRLHGLTFPFLHPSPVFLIPSRETEFLSSKSVGSKESPLAEEAQDTQLGRGRVGWTCTFLLRSLLAGS